MNAPTPAGGQSAVQTASSNTGWTRWVSGLRGSVLAVAAAALVVGLYLRGGKEEEQQPGTRGARVTAVVGYPRQEAPPQESPRPAPPDERREAEAPPPPKRPPPPDIPDAAYKASARIALRAPQRREDGERPGGRDPADPETALAMRLKATRMDTRQAAQVPDPAWMVRPGTSIPCVLDTAIDSTHEGQVICTVRRDVWCSTGHNKCLDAETTIIMEAKADMRPGQERLFITAGLAVTPDHVTIDLESAVTDALGRSGVGGEVNDRRGERLWNALAVGLSGTGAALAQRGLREIDVPGSAGSLAGRNLGNSFRPEMNVPPVLTKHQGEVIHINVSRWLNFAPAYQTRLR